MHLWEFFKYNHLYVISLHCCYREQSIITPSLRSHMLCNPPGVAWYKYINAPKPGGDQELGYFLQVLSFDKMCMRKETFSPLCSLFSSLLVTYDSRQEVPYPSCRHMSDFQAAARARRRADSLSCGPHCHLTPRSALHHARSVPWLRFILM